MSELKILEGLKVHGDIKLSGAGPVLTFNSTNNDSGARINVTGLNADSDDLFRVQDSGATRLNIKRDGKVGIGTTSPRYTLHSFGSGNHKALMLQCGDSANEYAELGFIASTSTGFDANLYIRGHRGSDGSFAGSYLTVGTNNTERMRITSGGNVGINTEPNTVNKLEVNGQTRVVGGFMVGDSSAGNTVATGVQVHLKNTGAAKLRLEDSDSSNLAFDLVVNHGSGFSIVETVGGDTGDNTRFFIEETTGDIGIGTEGPTSRLTVYDSAGQATTLANSVARSAVYINADSANGSNNLRIGESGSGAYFLQVSNSDGTTPYAIHLNPFGGNVGVGTNNPTNKLEVAGTIYSHTNIIASATIGNKGTNKGINFENPQEGVQTARIDSDRLRFYFGGSGGSGETVTFNENGTIGVNTTSPHSGTKMQICGGDTTPSLNTAAIDDTALVLSNSDDDYGMVFATDGSGKGYIQQRRTATATYYDMALQPYGGNVGIGLPGPTYKLDILGSGAIQRIRSTNSATYAEMHFENNNNQKLVLGSIGSTYSSAAWAGMRYLYSTSGDLAIKSAAAIRFYGNTLGTAETARITSTGLGINTTSPAAKLDVQPASNGKITKFGNDLTTQYTMTGQSNHTLTLTCGSYYQAEVIITANQTNGGAYNNLYIRGIWHNNHESHHWEEIEHIGELSGSSFTITVSQNTTSSSGKLVIQHNYSSGSFVQAVTRVTDFYNTHAYTLT